MEITTWNLHSAFLDLTIHFERLCNYNMTIEWNTNYRVIAFHLATLPVFLIVIRMVPQHILQETLHQATGTHLTSALSGQVSVLSAEQMLGRKGKLKSFKWAIFSIATVSQSTLMYILIVENDPFSTKQFCRKFASENHEGIFLLDIVNAFL